METYQLLVYATGFITFFLQTNVSSKHTSNRLFNDEGYLAGNKWHLAELYAGGIFWLALFPAAFPVHSAVLKIIPATTPGPLQIIPFILLLTILVITGINRGGKIIPAIQHETLPKNFLHYYFPLRIFFIFSYELFFRGFLLFDVAAITGFPIAIICSTGLTVLIHIFNNRKEMLACVPFGLALSFCCVLSGSVWPAIVLHIALCVSYEASFLQQYFITLKTIK